MNPSPTTEGQALEELFRFLADDLGAAPHADAGGDDTDVPADTPDDPPSGDAFDVFNQIRQATMVGHAA